MTQPSTVHFRIVSPQKVLFENEALSVSSKNSKGNFDILPGHANFMTIIENAPLIIRLDKIQQIKFDISFGVIYSINGNVNIYTDLPEEKLKVKTNNDQLNCLTDH